MITYSRVSLKSNLALPGRSRDKNPEKFFGCSIIMKWLCNFLEFFKVSKGNSNIFFCEKYNRNMWCGFETLLLEFLFLKSVVGNILCRHFKNINHFLIHNYFLNYLVRNLRYFIH